MVEIIDYNIYTTPFKDLPCLEDAIQKSYSTDDEQNRTVSISTREYPASMPYGIEALIEEGHSNYFSVIERHAIYYGVSILQNKVNEIVKKCRIIAKTGSVLDNDMRLYNTQGIPFKTRTKKDKTNISMPYWCSEWISSNHRYLNIPAGRLSAFILIVALSKSTIPNVEVSKEIKDEAEWFLGYVKNCLDKVQ
jgi:hypothetical protein